MKSVQPLTGNRYSRVHIKQWTFISMFEEIAQCSNRTNSIIKWENSHTATASN